MLDRQDIDALLVGALYGELSSSDEAILTAHLESHPADRTALDDLKSVRAKFQTSRIFELQLEPPQAVSALLLQEAARRAPKIEQRKESWFKRFVTTFIAHPAMAAAATLVLVVGVAGTLYLKGDRPIAEQTIAQSDVTRLPSPAVATPPMESANAAQGSASDVGGDKAEAVAVKLADEEQAQEGRAYKAVAKNDAKDAKKGMAEAPATPAAHAGSSRDRLAFGNVDSPKRETKPQATTPKPDVPRKQYVEVGRADRAPKDLERSDDSTATGAAGGTVAMDGDAPRQAGPGNGLAATTTKSKEASPPPPPVVAAAPAADPGAQPAPAKKSAQKPNTELAWAQTEHQHVAALVKEGKCQEAAPFAIAIKNRAPDYYASNVATDRALKPCMPYITDTSERSEKAAAKRATDTK